MKDEEEENESCISQHDLSGDALRFFLPQNVFQYIQRSKYTRTFKTAKS
jgi:hypothetical protein